MDTSPKEHRATLLALLAAYLYATDAVGAGAKLLLWFIPWYFTGGRHWLYLAWHSAGRDFRLGKFDVFGYAMCICPSCHLGAGSSGGDVGHCCTCSISKSPTQTSWVGFGPCWPGSLTASCT